MRPQRSVSDRRRNERASSERDAGRNRLDEDWHSEIENGPSHVHVEDAPPILYDARGWPVKRKVGFR